MNRSSALWVVILLALTAVTGVATAGQPPYRNSPEPAPEPANPSDPASMDECQGNATTEDARWKCRSDYCADHQDDYCAYYCWKYADPHCPSKSSSGPGNGTHSSGTGSGSSGNQTGTPMPEPQPAGPCAGEPDAKAREECRIKLCREHPEKPQCRGDGNTTKGNQTQDAPKECRKKECPPPCPLKADRSRPACPLPPPPSWCAEGRVKQCSAVREFVEAMQNPVRFDLLPTNDGFANYTVRGTRIIDSLVLETEDRPDVHREKAMLRIRDGSTRLDVNDEPGGLIRFRGDDAALLVTFPETAQIRRDTSGALLQFPDGPRAVLIANQTEWQDNRTVRIEGFASIRLLPAPAGPQIGHATIDSVQQRHVGAEVKIAKDGPDSVQVLAFEDLQIKVQLPPPAVTNQTVRVELSANVTGGRTVVLNLDPAVLGTPERDDLLLRYFDVRDDGSETQVVFREAASLADVMDPTDDGGQPEYWVVSDQDGLHVMVSVPHWSVHAVTLTSLANLVQPSVLLGIVAGAAGILVAVAGMFWPRRREE